MPELKKEQAACFMDGIGDRLPGLDLGVIPDARCLRVASRLGRDVGGFRNNKSGTSTLRVVLRRVGGHNPFFTGARTRQGCHHNAVAERQ